MLKPVVNVMVKAARLGGNVLLRNMHRLDALDIVEKGRMDYASEVDGLADLHDVYQYFPLLIGLFGFVMPPMLMGVAVGF